MQRGQRIGGTADEVDILAGIGKDAYLPEGVPGRHGAGIVVAGQAVSTDVITGGDDLAHSGVGLVGTASPDVEVGREKSGLVAYVVAAGHVEKRVEALHE